MTSVYESKELYHGSVAFVVFVICEEGSLSISGGCREQQPKKKKIVKKTRQKEGRKKRK